MGLKIGILGQPDGWYVRDLLRAAEDESLEVISFRDLATDTHAVEGLVVRSVLAPHDPARADQIKEGSRWLTGPTPAYDALLVRSMPLGSLEQIVFRMNALHLVERQGVPVINAPRCLEISIDKWLTLDRLQAAGLPIPRTVCCQTRGEAMMAFETLQRDCVLKPIFGSEGKGLIRVDSEELAWRVFGAIEQTQGVLYLQEFLRHPGFDLRVLVIGDELYAVERHAQGDWRTNVSRGAHAVPHALTDEERSLALLAARTVGGTFVGVDLLTTCDGRTVVLEVNAVPGWRGTSRALQIDVARKILDHLSKSISR